jgi:tartrate dehydratase beta subunit/fumarate hydratase class I family protein
MAMPDELKILFKAFDKAWEIIAPTTSGRADAIEATRMRLANVILGLASGGERDVAVLKSAAVQIMRRPTAATGS